MNTSNNGDNAASREEVADICQRRSIAEREMVLNASPEDFAQLELLARTSPDEFVRYVERPKGSDPVPPAPPRHNWPG